MIIKGYFYLLVFRASTQIHHKNTNLSGNNANLKAVFRGNTFEKKYFQPFTINQYELE